MEQSWAQFAYGRTKKCDFNYHYAPTESSSYDFPRQIFSEVRKKNYRVVDKDTAFDYLAFDGERWLFGKYLSPAYLLNDGKFPHSTYACDNVSRKTDWFHGFISNSDEFPNSLPDISNEKIAKFHQDAIVPIWNSRKKPLCKETNFEERGSIPISSVFSKEQITQLKEAFKKRKPIILHRDAKSYSVDLEENNLDQNPEDKQKTPAKLKKNSEKIQQAARELDETELDDTGVTNPETLPQNSEELDKTELDDPAEEKQKSNTAAYAAGAAGAALLVGAAVSASDDKKKQKEAKTQGQEPKKGISFRTVALCVVGVVLAGFAGRELWKRSGQKSQQQAKS